MGVLLIQLLRALGATNNVIPLLLGTTDIDKQSLVPPIKAVNLTECNGPELTNCTVTPRNSCNGGGFVVLLGTCNAGWS